MSVSINHVIVSGNLTRDPEAKFLANDKCVTSISIAHNKKYRTAGGEQKEDVSYIDVTAWGKTGENVAKYCTKGSGVIVEGDLRQERWEKDGQARSKLLVNARLVHFMPKREGQHEQSPSLASANEGGIVNRTVVHSTVVDDEPKF